MGSWNNRYFGLALKNKDTLGYAEKIFDCWDIADCKSRHWLYGEPENGPAFEEEWDLFGSGTQYSFSTFGILYKLFGEIKVCDVEDIGNMISDSEMYDATMYDSKKKKWYSKHVQYSMGDQTVGEDSKDIHDVVTWEDLREEIEQKVESVNRSISEDELDEEPVSVSWINGGHGIEPDPDDEYFMEICNDIFWEKFSYGEYGTEFYESELEAKDFEINQEELSALLEAASAKGYSDLVDFITERMNSDDLPDCTADSAESTTENKFNLAESVVITTGLSPGEENWVRNLVESKGGSYKDKFMKKITCLVINPEYSSETVKLKKTKELIEQGKDIKILTLDDFKRMFK